MWIQSLFLVLTGLVGLRHLAQVVIYPEDPYSDVISHPDFRPTPETSCYLSVDQMIGNTSMFFTVYGYTLLPGGSVIDLDIEDESSTTLVELDMHVPNARLPYLYERKKKSRTKRKAISRQDYRWPGGIIPYEFVTKDFTASEVFHIKQAMHEWMTDTCIVFRPATASDKNKIKIQNGVGCMSQLGMTGGTQILNLEAPGCRNGLMYLHELGHAIGLVHEHQLPDRDEYISINFSNVVPDMQVWFEKYSPEEVNTYGVPYEYASVMHYGISAFSRDQKKQTIRALDESREQEIGAVRTRKLAFSDIKVVNLMYDCGKNCPPDPTCKTPGYLNKTCHCVCPLLVNCSQENFHLGKGGGWRSVEECRNIWNDTDCEPWAKRGECNRNPVWMKENCRKSCKRCPQDCRNFQNDTDCETRAKNGECKTNQTWMAENCRKSCNLCWDDCKNSWNDTECDTWAKNGECSANSAWMRSNCQRSCNSCHDECTNYHNNNECEDWARNGECRKNPKWMTENCRKSCKKCFDSTNCKNPGHKIKLCHCVCPTEYEENSDSVVVERWDENAECKNKWKNETECETWALNGECKINKHWMRKNCKKSCMNCTDDCKNIWSDTECESWANTSQCEINKNWMEKHCQQSCSACSNSTLNGTMINSTDTVINTTDTVINTAETIINANVMHSTAVTSTASSGSNNETTNVTFVTTGTHKQQVSVSPPTIVSPPPTTLTQPPTARTTSAPVLKKPATCINKWGDKPCSLWQARGDCKFNAAWMKRNCALACDSCDT